MTITIRLADDGDEDAIWAILEPVIRAGETYALERNLGRDEALVWWRGAADQTLRQAFVALWDDAIVGTYFLVPNQRGGGAHVGNCGYMVRADMAGRGVARMMAADSIERARAQGFRAIQFNYVVSTNVAAVAAWQRAGFAIVGTVPGAFDHPVHGFVDVYVMHRPT